MPVYGAGWRAASAAYSATGSSASSTREPAGEVHLVALAGPEQLEDRVDARFEVVAVEARAATRRWAAGRSVARCSDRGELGRAARSSSAAAGAVAAHGDPRRRADRRERPEAGEHGIGDAPAARATPTGDDPLERVPELERAPADPQARAPSASSAPRASAPFATTTSSGSTPTTVCAPAPERRRAGVAGEPRQQRGGDRVGEAHRLTVPPGPRRSARLWRDPDFDATVGTMAPP